MTLAISEFVVGNYMTAYPISVEPKVSLRTVVDFMASNGIGSLIVNENDEFYGLVTEREILQQIASEGKIPDRKIIDVQSETFVTIRPDTTVMEAAKLMITKKSSRLLVFADQNKLVGIVTASDIVRAFRKTDYAPSLENIASTTVYQLQFDDSILQTVKMMNEKRIGSVVVKRGQSYGIFTERDLLVRVLSNDVDLKARVGEYSSFPLLTAKFGIKANEAASIMAANNIKRLGLTKNGSLVGMVTARDVVDAFQNITMKT